MFTKTAMLTQLQGCRLGQKTSCVCAYPEVIKKANIKLAFDETQQILVIIAFEQVVQNLSHIFGFKWFVAHRINTRLFDIR